LPLENLNHHRFSFSFNDHSFTLFHWFQSAHSLISAGRLTKCFVVIGHKSTAVRSYKRTSSGQLKMVSDALYHHQRQDSRKPAAAASKMSDLQPARDK